MGLAFIAYFSIGIISGVWMEFSGRTRAETSADGAAFAIIWPILWLPVLAGALVFAMYKRAMEKAE